MKPICRNVRRRWIREEEKTDLVRDVERIKVARQSDVRLFLSIRSDEGVDLCGLDIIQLFDGLSDLTLIGLDIDNKHEGIVFLNLLHRTLRVERRDDGVVLVHSGCMRDRRAWVLWHTRETERLGTVKGD